MFMKRSFAMLGLVVLAGAAAAGYGLSRAERLEQVRERGAEVMPFSLDRTVHSFVEAEDGGVQTVVVRDSVDSTDVALIRGHLRKIAVEFEQGRFEDPATVHGSDMAGLRTLSANPRKFTVTYEDTAGGAQITYRSSYPAIVEALHQWFAAQLADHGSDATSHDISGVTAEMWRLHHPGETVPDWVGDGTDASP